MTGAALPQEARQGLGCDFDSAWRGENFRRIALGRALALAACLIAGFSSAERVFAQQVSPQDAASQNVLPQNTQQEMSPAGKPALVAPPAIRTSSRPLSQPRVQDAVNLPFAPEPQAPSLAVTQSLGTAKPLALQKGVETPVSTGQPLQLSLDDSIRLALEHNLSIAINNQTLRQISGARLNALNALIPSLSAQAMSSTQQINLAAMGFDPSLVASILPAGSASFNPVVKVDVTSAQVNVSQALFNLPAFEIYRAAKEQATVAQMNLLRNRADVVQQVATQYLRVLADETSIRNAQSQLESDRELERQAQAKKDAGTGTNLDLLRAQVDRQQREQQLVQAQNSFEKDKIQLNRAMGLAADQPLELTDPVPYHELAALPLETATQVAYKRRKDLLSLEAQFRSARLERKAITYERLPAATLSGYYGVIGQTQGMYHGAFVAQGGVNFPIFQEARIRGDREVADAQLARLRSQISSLRSDLSQQIRSALLDVETANDQVKAASSNVTLATEALSETQMRYRAGIDDTLPVVRAQATQANAQAQLVDALFQFNQSKLALARSIGVLESQYDSYLNE